MFLDLTNDAIGVNCFDASAAESDDGGEIACSLFLFMPLVFASMRQAMSQGFGAGYELSPSRSQGHGQGQDQGSKLNGTEVIKREFPTPMTPVF